jgi:pilus assembly protein CpaF
VTGVRAADVAGIAGIADDADSADHADAVERLCRLVAEIPGDADAVVRAHVDDVLPLARPERREQVVAAAVARLAGLDVLDALLADPAVDEILVNAGGDVWVERHGVLEPRPAVPAGVLPVVLERILAPIGRRLDRSNPVVDARLPDGSRVCAVVEPVAVDGTTVSIRRFRPLAMELTEFCSDGVADVLTAVVDARCNVVVSGATSTGKTSLLGALLRVVDPGERIVVLEDTAELTPTAPHIVRLEARAATPDGVHAVTLADLVRTALRLRPDRLVVGEVRGDEVLALVQAMNTGHDGSLSTCHANSTLDALHRLETLAMHAAPTWPLAAIRLHLTRSIDVVVHVERGPGAMRRVAEIAEVVTGDGPPRTRPLATASSVVGELRRGRVGSRP